MMTLIKPSITITQIVKASSKFHPSLFKKKKLKIAYTGAQEIQS